MRLALALTTLLLLPACLGDLKPGAPPVIRWFQAEVEPGQPVPADAGLRSVRVDPVVSWNHLGERLVWRESEVEYGYSELERWTELPAHYLARAVDRKLHLEQGVPRAVGRPELVLDLDLVAFEEDLIETHQAMVTFHAVLEDDQRVLLDRMYSGTVAIEGQDAADVALALRAALAQQTERLAQDVRALARRP